MKKQVPLPKPYAVQDIKTSKNGDRPEGILGIFNKGRSYNYCVAAGLVPAFIKILFWTRVILNLAFNKTRPNKRIATESTEGTELK